MLLKVYPRSFSVDSVIARARTLIRVAGNAAISESDRLALLEWADELLSAASSSTSDDGQAGADDELTFPIPIFRTYKHQRYVATLLRNWRVSYKNRIFDTPSAAATEITGNQVNGWRFWRFKKKGETLYIDRLRSESD